MFGSFHEAVARLFERFAPNLGFRPSIGLARRAARPRLRLELLEGRDVPNADPVLEAVPERLITANQPFYLQLWATDADNDLITYSAVGLPAGLTLNATTGTVTGALAQGNPDDIITVTFTAADGKGKTHDQTTMFTVTAKVNPWVVNTIQDTNDVNPGDNVPLDVDGKVSLRAAIQQANANRQAGSFLPVYIEFDPVMFAQAKTITLAKQLDPIVGDVTITGTGKDNVFITGGGNAGIFHVLAPSHTAIAKLTLQSGSNRQGMVDSGTGHGGAIGNIGKLFVDSVRIRGCTAEWGGAIYTNSAVTVIDSHIIDNKAVFLDGARGNGGAIVVETTNAHITVSGSEIKDNTSVNRGGGISLRAGGKAFLSNTSLIHNVGPGGGGVYNSGGGWFGMVGGKMERNEATNGRGGGILTEGVSVFKDTAFNTNKATQEGGAINLLAGTCNLTGCSFDKGNQATDGGPKVAQRDGTKFNHTDCVNFDPATDLFVYPA